MKAHVLDGDTVVNSIIVNSLDDLPNLIAGDVGGIGWKIVDGVLTEPEITISDEKKSADARGYRNGLLAETDWTASSDVTMSDAMKAYRQALRDVPAQSGFPTTINWPELGE